MAELKLSRAFGIFEQFKAQITESFLAVLERKNISIMEVPAHCTDHIQPDHL